MGPRICKHCPWSVYAGAGQAQQELQPDRHVGRGGGPQPKKFRADGKASGKLAQHADQRRSSKTGALLRVCGGETRCIANSAAAGASSLLRAGVSGILSTNDVESVERLHQRVQEA